ncbi:hypothetical protein [Allosphingosinicella sp.]|jgi:hypothetical protein|uniref:hypothetical protein n=1 Tax=Allosphingosinicella sp. TaxID=2823234 RepID=UPI002EE7984B
MKRLAIPLSLILIAGCARTEDASVDPPGSNESYNAVEKVRSGEGDEQEPALGEWRRSLQAEAAAIEFGPQGTAPLLSVVCADRGGLILQRHGAVASGAAPMMSVSVGGQGRQLPVTAVTGASPMLRASIPSGDALLAQLSGAQAPITLRSSDGTAIILPPSPLIGEFSQGCATGTQPGRTAAPAPAAGNQAAPAPSAPTANQSNMAAPAR